MMMMMMMMVTTTTTTTINDILLGKRTLLSPGTQRAIPSGSRSQSQYRSFVYLSP